MSPRRPGAALVALALALSSCAGRPLARQEIAAASTSDLFSELKWLNRGPDSADFGEGGRSGYFRDVQAEILDRRDDWSDEEKALIRAGRVELGMRMAQVAASIGWPEEWPFWDARRPSIGLDGDDLARHSAAQDAMRWTYRYPEGTLRVWFLDERAYRIMDNRTGRIEDIGAPDPP